MTQTPPQKVAIVATILHQEKSLAVFKQQLPPPSGWRDLLQTFVGQGSQGSSCSTGAGCDWPWQAL